MGSRGHAPSKPKAVAARASGVFRVTAREEALAVEAVQRIAARSAGRPLGDATRAEMEDAFGYDFGLVRVHTDDAAAEVAQILDADAVSLGEDIYFAEGAYRPGDPVGKDLLAHELAHVAQHGDQAVTEPETRVSEEDDALEQIAGALSREVARGELAGPDTTAVVDRAARTIARRAAAQTTPQGTTEPSLPLGEMRIVERLAGILLGDFWKDPDDKSGRIRNMLERLGDKTRHEVIEVVEKRLADADRARFDALVHAEQAPGTEVQTPAAGADESSREQRQERSDEENASTRNRDGGAQDPQAQAPQDKPASEGESGKGTEGEATAGPGESAEKDGGEEGEGFFGQLAGAWKKALGIKSKKRKSAKKAKKATKGQKGKRAGKDDEKGEKDPEKPSLGNGKGAGEESEDKGGGEEKPEGAEVEAKAGGGGEGGAPGAGGSEDAPVDLAPFDRALDERKRDARDKRRTAGGPGGAAGMAVAGTSIPRGGPSRAAASGPEAAGPTAGDEGAASGPQAIAGDGGGGGAAAGGNAAAAARQDEAADGGERAEARGVGNEGAGRDEGPQGEAGGGAEPAPAEGAAAGEGGGAEAEGETQAGEGKGDGGDATGSAPAGEAQAQAGEPTQAEGASATSSPENAAGAEAASSEAGDSASRAEPAPQEVTAGAATKEVAPAGARGPGPAEGPPRATEVGEGAPAAVAEVGGAGVQEGAEGGGESTAAGPEAIGGTEGAAPEGAEAAGGGPAGGDAAGASEGPTQEAGGGEGGAEAQEADAGGGEATVDAGGGGDGGAEADSGSDGGAGEGGGGGGGGGSPIEDKPQPEPPDVSNAAPPEAMAAMAGLPPATLQRSLGGVSQAAGRTVDTQRQDLAENPPEVKRPSGAPADHAPTANTKELAGKLPTTGAGKVDPLAAGKRAPDAKPEPAPEMGAPARLPSPAIPGDAKVDAQNVAALQGAVDDLPTTDPALHVTAGATPKLALEGEADPSRAHDQRTKNDESAKRELDQGAKDAAQPMGESAVYPHSPAETLKAEIPQGGSGGGKGGGATAGAAAGGGGGAADDEAASIVAQEQHGDEIAAHVGDQSAAMRTAQEKHDTDAQAEKEKSQKAVDDSINASAKKQEDARTQVKSKVATQRGAWTEGQTKAVTTAQQKGDTAVGDADKTVAKQRADGEASAQGEIDKGDEDIRKEREKAEKTARDERANAKKESHEGFLGWIGSKVSSFFNSIKQAIGDAFDAARKFVKAAIKKAQELAVKVIDAARDAIVSAIKLAGEALMEIGDVMLAAFPELRDKYKKAIQGLVDDAVAAVDALADELKKDVVAFLDLLGKGLDALLGLLLDALNAIVDAVASYVKGIIDAAKAVIQALGAFWQIIKDVAANPGQWISNLGASVVDGIKHHLIKAFKKAIKKWFNDTVESVIGVGKAILGLLRKGGITFKMIAKMAWEALKAAIPSMLIQLLIEKLVAMIVPAAGALMTIIEGIKAAWGTIQQIIAAFEIFMKFLKAVKGGSAGRLFAETLASAAIVVIQFVAQWLLGKLKGGAGGKVGGKLREMAKKIMDGLKKAGKAIGRAARRVGRAIVKGVKAIVKGVKRGAKWVAGKVKKVIQRIANNPLVKKILASPAVKKLLGAVKKGIAKVKGWVDKGKKKFKDWREKRRARKEKRKKDRSKGAQERLDKAVAALRPAVHSVLEKGVSRIVLKVRLAFWRVRHRLTRLSIDSSGAIVATVNPQAVLDTANPADVGRALLPILAQVESRVLAANRRRFQKTGESDKELDTIDAIRAYREGRSQAKTPGLIVFNRNNLAQYFRPGDSNYVSMEKAGRLPSDLLMTLERARGPGNVVAMDVADAMRTSRLPGADAVVGNRNLMSGIGAAKAADQREFVERRGAPGRLTSSKDPRTIERAQRTVDEGDASRAQKLGEIFQVLRAALQARDPKLLALPDSPLAELAKAFDAWLNANMPDELGDVSTKELRETRLVLRTKLRAFMYSRLGA